MMSPDHLRLAAATVHALHGAELRLRTSDGEEAVVSRHPSADLTPCASRRVVIEAGRRGRETGQPGALRVDQVEVGGALCDVGGGVISTRTSCGREQRWVATTLDWRRVRSLLEATNGADVAEAAIEATVAPDLELEVTLVGLTSAQRRSFAALDRVAVDVAAALLVDELVDGRPDITERRREVGGG